MVFNLKSKSVILAAFGRCRSSAKTMKDGDSTPLFPSWMRRPFRSIFSFLSRTSSDQVKSSILVSSLHSFMAWASRFHSSGPRKLPLPNQDRPYTPSLRVRHTARTWAVHYGSCIRFIKWIWRLKRNDGKWGLDCQEDCAERTGGPARWVASGLQAWSIAHCSSPFLYGYGCGRNIFRYIKNWTRNTFFLGVSSMVFHFPSPYYISSCCINFYLRLYCCLTYFTRCCTRGTTWD